MLLSGHHDPRQRESDPQVPLSCESSPAQGSRRDTIEELCDRLEGAGSGSDSLGESSPSLKMIFLKHQIECPLRLMAPVQRDRCTNKSTGSDLHLVLFPISLMTGATLFPMKVITPRRQQ